MDNISSILKSLILFVIGIINISWVLCALILKKNFNTKIQKAYIIFAFLVVLWVWSNAYAGSKFFTAYGEKSVVYTFILAGFFSVFAVTTFYYISALLKSVNNQLCIYEKVFIGVMIIVNLLFNTHPKLAVEHIAVFSDGSFELVQSSSYLILYAFFISAIFLSWINIIKALRRSGKEKKQIEQKKFLYICVGISIMYASAIFFHSIVPHFWQNYSYFWIPPALSILDVLIVGYGVLVHRFPDIQFHVANFLKRIISFLIAIYITWQLYSFFQKLFIDVSLFFLYTFPAVTLLVVYTQLLRFFHSAGFHHFFGITSVEFFQKELREFQRNNKIYTSLQSFEQALQHLFCDSLKISSVHIIEIDKEIRKKLNHLVQYSRKSNHILVTKEILFRQRQNGEKFNFLEEIKDLGEICIPIFYPEKKLIGFCILGKKPFDELYSKEEIEALEQMRNYLNFIFAHIICYSQRKRKSN